MLPGSPMFIFLCAFFILNFVPVSIKFALLYWQQNILYFLTEKYSNQVYLISTVNSKPNRFLQLHYKIHFSDPPPAFSTNQKGLVHVDVFCWVSRHFRGTWLHVCSLCGNDFILVLLQALNYICCSPRLSRESFCIKVYTGCLMLSVNLLKK